MWDLSSVPPADGAFDERRLRGVLRLILDPVRADRATDQVLDAADPLAGLRQLAADLTLERRLARLFRRLSLGRYHATHYLSAHLPDDVSDRAVLMLLVHVGLTVNGERLEDGFGLDDREIGLELLAARSVFCESAIVACHEYGWLIGRYRDRQLAADERLRLLSHATTCASCRDALDRAQQADAMLLANLERYLEQAPVRPIPARTGRSRHAFGSRVIAMGSIAALLGLIASVSMIVGLSSSNHEPVPLFEGGASDPTTLDGWLLQVSPVGYLEGVNLATGQKRGLDSGDGGNTAPSYRVSRTQIAAWRPSDGQRDDVLTIGPIGKPPAFRLTWNRRFVYWYPSAWLDDDTLLIVKSPEHISGETERQYVDRLSIASRLVAFDALTGSEQVLMTGNIAAAFPSPDGTMLAILHPIDRRWPGNTLEMRPFDGQSVGDPIIQIDHRVVADGVWLADSSQYVTSVITDASVTMRELTRGATLADYGAQDVALVGIARDGTQRTLATARVPERIVPLSSSPDGRSIVYQVREDRAASTFPGVRDYEWRCYRLALLGGEPTLLASGETPERIFSPAWSPDGSTLVLPVARAFPLDPDGQLDQPINPNATTLLVYGEDWRPGIEPQRIFSSGRDLYGWLPPGSLEQRLSGPSSGGRSLAAVEATEEMLDHLSIDAASISSSNGLYVVARERDSRTPLIWSIEGDRHRRLDGGISDLAWFNQGSVTIGVATNQDGIVGSRIVLTAADIASSAAYLDHQLFDPANLGSDPDQRYARPTVSPTGTVVAFFVVDRRHGQVSLWVDDGEGPSLSVAEWTVPLDRGIDPPVVAIWASADTLLYIAPDDWRTGVPRTAVLSRMVIDTGAGIHVDELTRFGTTRSADGVVLVEMALSPDRTLLAYRLRHIMDAAVSGSTDDTLHVASAGDLGRAIELERGGYGDGLAWTASGDGLAAGIRGRIALYSPDGRDLDYLSPRGVSASSPLAIGNQIWFEVTEGGNARIVQAELD